MIRRARWCGLALAAALLLAATASAREWTDDLFTKKVSAGRPFMAVASRDPAHTHSVIGSTRFYQVQPKDTFLDVARYYDLGYNEILEANPGVDPWIPPPGQIILLPTEWVLPETEFKGIVINIPEMRLYYFHPGGAGTVIVNTYPVGLGRDDWRTPEGKFRVRDKTVNPTWVLPESIKAEHRRDGKPAPDFIAGGAPDNPLGKYRLSLTLPLYGIHGTDIPWGVGMQVSHGCIRLYNEDIEALFREVRVGTPGEFVYQPVKVGMRDDVVYVEVHPDIYGLKTSLADEAEHLLARHGWADRVDRARLRQALDDLSGVPVAIERDRTLTTAAAD